MREVFLSHASQDHAAARRLREVLVAHGVRVWFSPHHIRGAQQWQDEIGEALARCDWFVVLLTPDAVNSMWVKRELSYALNQRRYIDRIIPLHFKKCDFRTLSWTLPQLHRTLLILPTDEQARTLALRSSLPARVEPGR